MSRFDYEQSKEIAKLDPTFAALIMAAYRKADSTNRVSLRISFPEITLEMESRYNLAGGLLPGEKAMLVEPEGKFHSALQRHEKAKTTDPIDRPAGLPNFPRPWGAASEAMQRAAAEPEDKHEYPFDSVVGLDWPEGTKFATVGGYEWVTFTKEDIAGREKMFRDMRFTVAKP